MNRLRFTSYFMVWFAAACGSAALAGSPSVKLPHVTARLLADRSAVAAGQTLRLGVQFKLESDWHMYWVSAGEPGAPALPTTFKTVATPGFSIGPPRFPPPQRHKSGVGGDLFILEGEPVVLFDVTPPARIDSKSVTFKIAADWLVCKKNCLPCKAELELTLPVAAGPAESKLTEANLFMQAAEALPLPPGKAGYVKPSGRLSQDRVRPGDRFEALLEVDVKAGHHIQSHKPPSDALIGTDVFIEPVDGFEIGKPVFPAGKERRDKLFGKVSEYAGRVIVRIPIEAGEKLSGDRTWIRGVLRYQACTDKGTCFPPEDVSFAIDAPLATAASPVRPVGEPASQHAAAPVAGGGVNAEGEQETGLGEESVGEPGAARSSAALLTRVQQWFERRGFLGYLALAFLGGLILNVMPCVLPVISLKVLSFVRQAQESRWRLLALGLVFSAGIIASFLILAVLASLPEQIGWGGLFQMPQVGIGLAAVVTALALSLFGVFTIGPPRVVGELGARTGGEGYAGAFSMGLLATLLGTACTAPFLSVVISFAVQRPPLERFAVFGLAGLGMAAPYILLTANPAWLRLVPRAGPWMVTFEQVMGFLLLGTVIWLLYPMPSQITGKGLVWALAFILAVSFAAWLYGKVEFGAAAGKKVRYYAAALLVILLGWVFPFRYLSTIASLQEDASQAAVGGLAAHDPRRGWDKEIPWLPYTRESALAKVREGHTVFVDYTADWCASCKTNEATSLNIPSTRELMRRLNVVPFRADYTNPNPQIKADFARLGRQGVPIYVIYRPGDVDHPILLPELLTPGIVHDALRDAGPSLTRRDASSELGERS